MSSHALIRDGVVTDVVVIQDGEPPLADRFPEEVLQGAVELRGGQIGTVAPGYLWDGKSFSAAPEPEAIVAVEPSLADLQAELRARMDELTQLQGRIDAALAKVP